MKILSMTATFGKLSGEKLTLQPGLNVITAPNEWGKSTWSAFILAMFYGIDTGSRRRKDALPDKEHYAPWSGKPMSGRMDLLWQGKHITIERSNKGRIPFGEFRAYETESGINVPELTGENCGITLLGVEKSVFERTGFLRLQDLPVGQDEALRKRLNALVTTGDESGTGENLGQKLKELKNKVHHNATGLLPQAESQLEQLQQKKRALTELTEQKEVLQKREDTLVQQQRNLKNHMQHLEFEQQKQQKARADWARETLSTARGKAERLERSCRALPSQEELEQKLAQIKALQQKQEILAANRNLEISEPIYPESQIFPEMSPEEAEECAKKDAELFEKLQNFRGRSLAIWWIFGIGAVLLGAGAIVLGKRIPGAILAVAGTALLVLGILQKQQGNRAREYRDQKIEELSLQYEDLPPEKWTSEAEAYGLEIRKYQAELRKYQEITGNYQTENQNFRQELESIAGNKTLIQAEQEVLDGMNCRQDLRDAIREADQAQAILDALDADKLMESAPAMRDNLTLSQAETRKQLDYTEREQQKVHSQLGRLRGQMDSLPEKHQLDAQLKETEDRIAKLRQTEAALQIAEKTRSLATADLQRRFSPRIAGRTRELMEKLTEGRYDRVMLDEDLQLQTAAQGEDTLLPCLWRSDGTMDQLYLALRLAVSQEICREAPLILDDAMVRFDDARLSEALKILKEEPKQVILFTCQNREQEILDTL